MGEPAFLRRKTGNSASELKRRFEMGCSSLLMNDARICDARPIVVSGRLRVALCLDMTDVGRFDGFLHHRDVDALVPRYILTGRGPTVGMDVLPTIAELTKSLLVGRRIRVNAATGLVEFLPWTEVSFTSAPPCTNSEG
jgi:hypothetical protein